MGSPGVARGAATMGRLAAFAWNGWQACYGISGSFRVEREAGLPWNHWQVSPGIEAALPWNTHPPTGLTRPYEALLLYRRAYLARSVPRL